jgi:hypothetical protein
MVSYIHSSHLFVQDHPHFQQLLSYLRDSHQSVQAVSGSTTWWDDFTIARNLLETSEPGLLFPDDGDEEKYEKNPAEARNPALAKDTVLRNEIERLTVANLPGKEDKAIKKDAAAQMKKARSHNPQSYVSCCVCYTCWFVQI